MNSHFFKTALVLGLLSAIGPFAIDMYLPALPSIGQSLGASMTAAQASLMAFFISLAVGQIITAHFRTCMGANRRFISDWRFLQSAA